MKDGFEIIAVLMRFVRLGLVGLLAAANVSAVSAAQQTGALRAYVDRFEGRWTGKQAEVIWQTSSEMGTAGFRVYRVDQGAEIPLHADWIMNEPGSLDGAEYRVPDADASQDATATYTLRELRMDGTERTVGVWTVQFAEFQDALPVEAAPSVMLAAATVPAPTAEPEPAEALKVPVDAHDLFSVSFADIATGLGLSPSAVAAMALADPPQLRMHTAGQSVAFLADATEARIVFYGWPIRTPYTKSNMFWIEPGIGQHMQRIEPTTDPVSTNLTFVGTHRFEVDSDLMFQHNAVRDDLYYWDIFAANHSTLGEHTYALPLDAYAGGDVTITVNLIGWNETANVSDHLAEFRVNDTWVGELFFDGKEDSVAAFTVSSNLVQATGNQLKITAVLQPGHTVSRFVLDWFELAYRQYYQPVNDLILAGDAGHARLSAARFAGPIVLNATDPHQPAWVADDAGTLSNAQSWAVDTDTTWALRERAAIQSLSPLAAGAGAWMLAETNAVDYLVIAPRIFESSARALAQYRADLGLRTAVALFEDICDQFAHGLATPEAIRAMLSHAHQHWAAPPWMVALAGRGHIDHLGKHTNASSGPNALPGLLAVTGVGLYAADGLLADLNGDGVPQLAIGRIPARSVAQLDAYIAKLQDYESAAFQTGYDSAFFVADNKDAGGDFTATNLDIAEETGKRYTVEHSSLDLATVAGVRADILDAFNAGSGLIHYTGHGNNVQFADENLFDVSNVNTLNHPPAPAVLALTCLIGRFDHPTQTSLSEALVLRPNGGSMVVFAPSGLSWNNYSQQFGTEFHRLHTESLADAIGPSLLHTRQSFGVLSGRFEESLRTYNLLGDPAVKLRGGERGTPPRWVGSYAQWRWERFSYAHLADNGEPPVSAPLTVGDGEQVSNFMLYATGTAPGSDLRPPGLRILGLDSDRGFMVEWPRRVASRDIDYVLQVSHDLKQWETQPADLYSTSVSSEPDGVMEWIHSSILRPETDRLFIQLGIQPK